jgi:hypothetical protein
MSQQFYDPYSMLSGTIKQLNARSRGTLPRALFYTPMIPGKQNPDNGFRQPPRAVLHSRGRLSLPRRLKRDLKSTTKPPYPTPTSSQEGLTLIMAPSTPVLPSHILDESLKLEYIKRLRWYMCVIVTLSSLGYPDVIPQVYGHLDKNLLASLSDGERFEAVQHIREGLIKSTGVVGAGRTGNAMRALSNCVPENLRQKDSPRSQESEETARARGKKFWSDIYARNPAFDPEASVRASPDYAFVVRGRCR